MLCSEGLAPRCAALDFGWVGEGHEHAEMQQQEANKSESWISNGCVICRKNGLTAQKLCLPLAMAGYGVRDVAYLLWDQIATNLVEDGPSSRGDIPPGFVLNLQSHWRVI